MIISLIIAFYIVFSLFGGAVVAWYPSDDLADNMKYFLKKMFHKKNLFGIIMSVIIFIVSMPVILVAVFYHILKWFITCIIPKVWDLGNRKE